MTTNSRKFVRFLSEQYHHNYGYINEENNKFEYIPMPIKIKRNLVRQFSPRTEQKLNQLKSDSQQLSETLENPIFTRVTSIEEDKLSNIIPSSSHITIETGLNYHRDIKDGSQRFRWNLLFNLLLWLIVPLPLWIPFVSNTVAYYLIPSIQGLFVVMWISK